MPGRCAASGLRPSPARGADMGAAVVLVSGCLGVACPGVGCRAASDID